MTRNIPNGLMKICRLSRRNGKYQVLPDTKKQFDVLVALMADSRVEEVVCATDAGREGELISA